VVRETFAIWVQFVASTALGCVAFWYLSDDPNPKVPLFGGLIAGIGGLYLIMFFVTWVRFGWRAARSLSFSDPPG